MDIRNISPLLIIVIVSILRNILNSRKVPNQQRNYRRKDIKEYSTLSETKEGNYYNTAYQNQDYSRYEPKKMIQKNYRPTNKKSTHSTKIEIHEDEAHGKGIITDRNLLINGIIMSEILGAPRSKKPYIPIIKVYK